MFDDDDFIPTPRWDNENDNNHDDYSERDSLNKNLYGTSQGVYLDEWIEQDIRDAYEW